MCVIDCTRDFHFGVDCGLRYEDPQSRLLCSCLCWYSSPTLFNSSEMLTHFISKQAASYFPSLYFFVLMQKSTKKDQERRMLPPACIHTPALRSGQRAECSKLKLDKLKKAISVFNNSPIDYCIEVCKRKSVGPAKKRGGV